MVFKLKSMLHGSVSLRYGVPSGGGMEETASRCGW